MNITQEGKSQFQETLSKVSSETRMEMIQLGLNPFLESDIEKYWTIRANAKHLSLKERFIASFQLLFKNKITDKLFAHMLCKINDDLQKHTTDLSTEYLDEVGKEGTMNPLVEKLEKKEPSGVSKVAPLYTESIKDALVDRYVQAIQNGELKDESVKEKTESKPNHNKFKDSKPGSKPRYNKKKKKPQSPSNTKKTSK